MSRVLVTGGSHGIGRATAEALAGDGWTVLVAARGREAVEETVSGLPGDGHRALILDVARPESWDALLDVLDEAGGLDGLCHAAAVIGPIGPIGTFDPAEFLRTLEIDLYGTFLAFHHVVPRLRARGGAAVAFSGGGATGTLPRYDAYAAAKAAVVRLTENVAALAAPDGIAVNCVAPGFVRTRMHDETLAAGPEAAGREYYERTRREVESGGDDLTAVTDLVSFLLSPAARAIHGKLISAQWDPWREEGFRRRLAEDRDLATLRRIDDQFFAAAP